MSILVLQHSASVGPGRLGMTLRDHGFAVDIRRIDQLGERGIPVDFDNVHAVISLGGEQNVTEIATLPWMQKEVEFIREAHRRQLPVVGLCLGHQIIAHALGGSVGPAATAEWGMHRVSILPPGQIETMLAGIPWDSPQFQAHNQEVTTPPPGATVLASSKACKVQVFKAGLRTYGFQYHFECDRSAIEAIMKDAPGGSPADLAPSLDANYGMFARLADRLCVNIAAFMFPFRKRVSA